MGNPMTTLLLAASTSGTITWICAHGHPSAVCSKCKHLIVVTNKTPTDGRAGE